VGSKHDVHVNFCLSKVRDQSGQSLSTSLLYGNTACILIISMHAKVQEILPAMRTDHLHTLKSITVTVNWSSLVEGLTDARNIITTGD